MVGGSNIDEKLPVLFGHNLNVEAQTLGPVLVSSQLGKEIVEERPFFFLLNRFIKGDGA